MSQGLIKIEDDRFPDTWLREGQINHSCLDIFLVNGVDVLKEADGLEDVNGKLLEYVPFLLKIFKS
jgi:hypothetical protein